MLSFIQFIAELAKDHVVLSPAEVQGMRDRFGDKTLQMGHLEEDGSMSVAVESIVEAVRTLGSREINEAVESLRNEEMVSLLNSAETLVQRVGEAERRRLDHMVEKFQTERDAAKAHQQWKAIEKMVFGVDFPD